MKWERFIHTGKNKYVPGDWNIIDDRSGFKIKASKATMQWDGMRTAHPRRRHEQDFLRSIKEQRVPWSRPEPTDEFVN